MPLVRHERPAAGEPAGLLVLHHGRGSDEQDLLGLADALDPTRRLHIVSARAPLRLQGAPGYHWYLVERVGRPDLRTFEAGYSALTELHDELWAATGISPARTVLGGFSMGTVMSYATGLGPRRPPVAGVLAFSGFVPRVNGWEPAFHEHLGTRVFIAHGRADPVIEVGFGRAARQLLEDGGLEVDYHESDAAHEIDPAHVPLAASWLEQTIA